MTRQRIRSTSGHNNVLRFILHVAAAATADIDELQWDAAFGALSVTRGILIGLEVSRLCWPRLHSRLCREVHVRHHISGDIRAELRQSALLLVPGAAEVAERQDAPCRLRWHAPRQLRPSELR